MGEKKRKRTAMWQAKQLDKAIKEGFEATMKKIETRKENQNEQKGISKNDGCGKPYANYGLGEFTETKTKPSGKNNRGYLYTLQRERIICFGN